MSIGMLAATSAAARDPGAEQPTTVDQEGTAGRPHDESVAPLIKLNVFSRLGSEHDAVRDEVVATVTAALEAEGYEMVDDAPTLVTVVITRPDPESVDYVFQLGYSRSADDGVHRLDLIECPRCSAEKMLSGVDEAAREVARQLRDDGATEDTEVDDEPVEDYTPAASEPAAEERPQHDGVWMWSMGIGAATIGGAVTLGSAIGIGTEHAEIETVSPIGYIMLGTGVVVTAVGGALIGVGGKRRRASQARLGLSPTLEGGLLTLRGRF